MTIKEVYYFVLQEIDKVKTVNYLLEYFNRDFNWSVDAYIKRRYPVAEVIQQTTDDLQNLIGFGVIDTIVFPTPTSTTGTYRLTIQGQSPITNLVVTKTKLGYAFKAPSNYYHYLKSYLWYDVIQTKGCYIQGKDDFFEPRRYTSTNSIVGFYDRPSYRNPLYFIYNDTGAVVPSIEFKTGVLEPVFKLSYIEIWYLKTPQVYTLTREQKEDSGDSSDVIEFPDYICIDIIKDLTTRLFERFSDPRLQNYPQIVNTDQRQQ